MAFKDMETERIHNRYKALKKRCNNPRARGYKYYGGKGIRVEFTFKEFKEWFLANMKDGYTIGRIDHDKNYTLNNIRCESMREQVIECNIRNARRIVLIYKDTKDVARIWRNANEAAEELCLQVEHVRTHCRNKLNTLSGKWSKFYIRYEDKR